MDDLDRICLFELCECERKCAISVARMHFLAWLISACHYCYVPNDYVKLSIAESCKLVRHQIIR